MCLGASRLARATTKATATANTEVLSFAQNDGALWGMSEGSVSERGRRSVAEFAVDDGHEQGCEEDPGELVPVEEGKAEERGGVPGVEPREAEAEVGQDEEELPASSDAAGGGLGGGEWSGHCGVRD